ncbi:MAG: T9SS type A sorting domain-containing protein, partial [Bacteroidetes bacterium]|nr:T9SS type A sorting domain-containing protein [Bacteroidota bacterium]
YVVIDSLSEFKAVLNYASELQDLVPVSEGRVKALIDTTIGVEEMTGYNQNLIIYPNPARSNSVVSFDISEPGIYSMKIFNLYGQEISGVFNQSLESGYQKKVLDVSGLSSGLYFVRLTNGRNTQSVKMIVE